MLVKVLKFDVVERNPLVDDARIMERLAYIAMLDHWDGHGSLAVHRQ